MKIGEALSYRELYQKLRNQSMPIRLAYKLNKLKNKLSKEAEFYEESFNKILAQYAERDDSQNFKISEDGTGIVIQKEFIKICKEKIKELDELEIVLTDGSFTFEELEGLTLTPAELSCIESLITE